MMATTTLVVAASICLYHYDDPWTSEQMTDSLVLASFSVALFNLGLVYASVCLLRTKP